ncbi:hypothetical protein MRX96_038262 [Rhipicephalus microplus]
MQAANEHTALHACCSSPDLQGNFTPLVQSPALSRGQHLLCSALLLTNLGHANSQVPEIQAPQCQIRQHQVRATLLSHLGFKDGDVVRATNTIVAAFPKPLDHLRCSPTSRVRAMRTSRHVPPLIDLCAHGNTTDAETRQSVTSSQIHTPPSGGTRLP